MESLPKEVWWEIFKHLILDDLLFVCKTWLDLIDAMPAATIQRYICQLNGLLGSPYDWRRGIMRDGVRRPARIFYEKLAFNQKILLPNTPLVWEYEKNFDRESYILGYKNRIPWRDIFDWLIATRISKTLHGFVKTAENYFKYMYRTYEQYRYYMLITYPVYLDRDTKRLISRVDPRGKYNPFRVYERYIDDPLWNYYSQSRPQVLAAIEAERVRFLSG